MVPWHLRPSSAEVPRNAGLARRPPSRQPRVITLSLDFAGIAVAVECTGLGIELIKAAPKTPPPSAWEQARPWLMRLGWTLKLALNSGTALLGWRSRRYGAAS